MNKENNPVVGTKTAMQCIPLPVSFLEWVSSEKYIRLSKVVGHKWFKIGESAQYTTIELYDVFIKEIEDEAKGAIKCDYDQILNDASKNFGGL